jgi:PAS domain S-box-containing protein
MMSPELPTQSDALLDTEGRPAHFLGSICEQFIQSVPDVVYVLDNDNRLVYWNKRMEAVTGYSTEELRNKSAADFFPPEEQALHEESIRRKREGYDEVESHLLTKDGQRPLYHWSGGPLKDANGAIVGVIGTGRDVTDRKRLEEAVQAQNRRLTELDRLKNTFVSAVSHELRTPLTSIRGYVEFLEDRIGGSLSPEQADFVHQIAIGARRLTRLVDDLLDFARLEAGTFRLALAPSDATHLVTDVVESLQPQAIAAQVKLEADVPDEPAIACLDGQRIEQVLINLVHNAVKFTPAGGHIRVRLEPSSEQLRLTVADNGPGIGPEHLERLFGKFYQVAPGADALSGVGLGLFISKALVTAHGGDIGVDSAPGKGATCWVSLPRLTC